MITQWDDYLIHQTAEPIIRPGVDAPNWMDRFYWNLHDRHGRFAIGLGFGQYRNTSRMDAIAYVLLPGQQRTLQLARRTTPTDFADPVIGPLRFTVEAPLERWRWQMADNPTGVTWDFEYVADRAPVEFAPFEFGEDGDRSSYRHFVQLGDFRGHVSIDGQRVDVDDALGLRDRSWGVRRSRERQGLHLWLQHRFDDRDVFVIFNEARDGSVAYCDGAVVDAQGTHRVTTVGHDLTFTPGTRDVTGGVVTVVDDRGERHDIEYERSLPGYVGGVGYGGWAGADHPDGLIENAVLDLDKPVQEILDQQPILLFDHICRVRVNTGPWTVGSCQIGITRSSSYTYRPRAVTAGTGS
jgi:hypothetical protein